jgi:23S rRNA pseudouridine2457 synthase
LNDPANATGRPRRRPLPAAGGRESGVILLNKPFGVLCQFSGDGNRRTLAEFISTPKVYPAGRLDADSEGLVVLTADGALQARISGLRVKLPKTYWVQVEGEPSRAALETLRRGVKLPDVVTRPAVVRRMPEPAGLWPRDPPIRVRRAIPTAWLVMTLREGKNRQVRRMTAAVGLPTLRLVRFSIGRWTVAGLAPGHWRAESIDPSVLSSAPATAL